MARFLPIVQAESVDLPVRSAEFHLLKSSVDILVDGLEIAPATAAHLLFNNPNKKGGH